MDGWTDEEKIVCLPTLKGVDIIPSVSNSLDPDQA